MAADKGLKMVSAEHIHLLCWVTLDHPFLMLLLSCPYPSVIPCEGWSRRTAGPGALGFACAEPAQIVPDPWLGLL